jgi:hypothetical protein
MKMVLGRSFTLATTKGHVIRFEKGVPVFVPPICIPDAIAIGAQPEDGSDPSELVKEPEAKTFDGPSDPVKREEALVDACKKIESMNARNDFTAAGVPSTDAMTRVTGFAVGAAERNKAWQAYSDLKANAEA